MVLGDGNWPVRGVKQSAHGFRLARFRSATRDLRPPLGNVRYEKKFTKFNRCMRFLGER
jgi:hypothetical protein